MSMHEEIKNVNLLLTNQTFAVYLEPSHCLLLVGAVACTARKFGARVAA